MINTAESFIKISEIVEKTPKNIKTSIVSEEASVLKLKEIVESWSCHVMVRGAMAERLEGTQELDEKTRQQLTHSMDVISCIFSSIELMDGKKPELSGRKIYVARDTDNVVQGIAILLLGKTENKIEYIATNPENLFIFGYEKSTRGAGTALIAHIARDTLAETGNKELCLIAFSSVVPFYKKIGFECCRKKKPLISCSMSIKSFAMKVFINVQIDKIKIKDKEPVQAKLKMSTLNRTETFLFDWIEKNSKPRS